MTTLELHPKPVAAAADSGGAAVGDYPNGAGDGSGAGIGHFRRTQSATVAA